MRTVLMVPDDRLAADVRSGLGVERGFEVVATFESLPGVEGIAGVLEPSDPEAVFVEVTAADRAAALLHAIRLACPDAAIVACAAALSGAEAVQWLRLGASDCFHSGMSADDVRALFERIRRSGVEANGPGPARSAGCVAGFVSLKPGSGASTLAAQAAFALQRQVGKSVLLVDLNLASGTTACWGEGGNGQPDVLQALAHLTELESPEGWQRWTIARNGIRVLPAPLVPAGEGLGRWSAGLRTLIGMARRHFDWILVDLPPAAEAGTAALAAGLDRVVAVATPELSSLHLASQRLAELVDAGTTQEALRVILNRTAPGDLIPLEKVEELFGHKLAGTMPDDYAALYAAAHRGLSGESALGGAVRRLAAELPGPGQRRAAAAVAPLAMIAAAPMLAAAG